MPEPGKKILFFIVAEVLGFFAIGYLVFGRELFVIQHPVFSYTVFGLMMVGLINILQFRSRSEFLLLCASVIVLYSLTWFLHFSYALTFRGLLWFLSVAIVAYASSWILRMPLAAKIRFGLFVVWIVLCFVLYILINFSDHLIIGLSSFTETGGLMTILRHSGKFGGSMGLGIGLGYDIARLLTSPRREDSGAEALPPTREP